MPAFTFEKLAPPVDRAPPALATLPLPAASLVTVKRKRRGVIIKILDRLTEAKLERSTRDLTKAKKPTRRPR